MKIEYKAYRTIIIATSLAFGYTVISGLIADYLGITEKFGGPNFKSLTQKIILTTLVGPIMETFIFQVIPYYLLKLFLEKVRYFQWIYIVLMGLLFAKNHSYSSYYMIEMILPGMFLCYMFIYLKKRFTYPIFYLILIHAFHNTLVLLFEYYMT